MRRVSYTNPMQLLVLIRHAESEGNYQNILTGHLDVPLTSNGEQQAKQAGDKLNSLGVSFDAAYTSQLQRARQTLQYVIEQLPSSNPAVTEHSALNERDFGDYTGLTKTTLLESLGEPEYKRIIRGWEAPAPQGESLQNVHRRATAFFEAAILQDLLAGRNVIVSSHHQTLRTLVKHIENLSDQAVTTFTIENAVPIVYKYRPAGGTLIRTEL